MSQERRPVPEHGPLKPCPFCGREALVTPHRDMTSGKMLYSVGCWQQADAFSRDAHWDDCPGPTTIWLSLERAVAQWNRRA